MAPLLAAAVAGCGIFGFGTMRDPNTKDPRYFQLALPGIDRAAEVSMQVADTLAIATGADIDRRNPPAGDPDTAFVGPIPGRVNALVVGWPGGCEERVDLALDEGAFGPNFTLKLLMRPDACHAGVVARRVIVTFETPVDAADFNLDVVQ